jgi:hypothetical protein
MEFEDTNVVELVENMEDDEFPMEPQPCNVGSSNLSLQFSADENNNNNSDVDMESPITGASQPVQVRGLEREASMHLSEVFNHSDLPKTPVPEATPNEPRQLSDFLETGGGPTTTRLAGVRKWIKEKLDEQEDNDNDSRTSKSLHDQGDDSERSSFNESATQIRGGNLPPGGGGWVPMSASQQV